MKLSTEIFGLQLCHLDDPVLFGHLVPFVYAKFPSEAMSSADLMKLLGDSLDGSQVADIVGEIIEENISLFKYVFIVSLTKNFCSISLSYFGPLRFFF